MTSTGHRDPRSIVTPDAFEVSAALVGMPLAPPWRRAVALGIDGVVIVILTAVTESFSLILGVIAAALFMRAGFRRTPVRGSVFGRAMRFSVGSLGLLIAMITAGLWSAFGIGFDREDAREQTTRAVAERAGSLLQEFGTVAVVEELSEAESTGDAVEIAGDLVRAGRELGLPDDVVGDLLLGGVPESAEWAAGWPAVVDSLLRPPPDADAAERTAPEGLEGTVRDRIRAEVAALSTVDAFSAYGAAIGSAPEAPEARFRLSLLRQRVFAQVAGDSVEALEARAAQVERERTRFQRQLSQTESELEAAQSRGLFRRLLDLAEQLGFGFGWAALYMTVVTTWWKGQTPGKRLLGIRVVRLDGEAITWWVAFERVGGYAAGVATGLLGFAQVWWDANRQAIHDRIVGTVVVRDGAERVTDWESAL